MKLKTLTLGHTKLLLRWLTFTCMWKRETETQAQVNFYAFHSLGLVNSDLRIRNTSRCTINRWTICHSLTNTKVQVQVQVELYCHSATCGDIQWNEMSCLTGPRCYINTYIQQWSKTLNLYTTNLLTDSILYINVYPIQLKIKDKKYKLCECFT